MPQDYEFFDLTGKPVKGMEFSGEYYGSCTQPGYIAKQEDWDVYYTSWGYIDNEEFEEVLEAERLSKSRLDGLKAALESVDNLDILTYRLDEVVKRWFESEELKFWKLTDPKFSEIRDVKKAHCDLFMGKFVVVYEDFRVATTEGNASWEMLPEEILDFIIGPNFTELTKIYSRRFQEIDDPVECGNLPGMVSF